MQLPYKRCLAAGVSKDNKSWRIVDGGQGLVEVAIKLTEASATSQSRYFTPKKTSNVRGESLPFLRKSTQ